MPTALKALAGNPGRRSARGEPRPAVRLPSAPEHLPAAAKTEWKRIGGELLALGLVSGIDRAALTVYCLAWARQKDAIQHIAREGTVVFDDGYREEMGEDGEVVRLKKAPARWYTSHWIAIERTANDQMMKALREFGMSPASRTKVSKGEEPAKPSPLQELLNKRRASSEAGTS